MTQPKERRWTGRWGRVTIITDEGYFLIALYFFKTSTIISFARSNHED